MRARCLAAIVAALSISLLPSAGNAEGSRAPGADVLNGTNRNIKFRVRVSPNPVVPYELKPGAEVQIPLSSPATKGELFLPTGGKPEVTRRILAGERYVIRYDRAAQRYDLFRVPHPSCATIPP